MIFQIYREICVLESYTFIYLSLQTDSRSQNFFDKQFYNDANAQSKINHERLPSLRPSHISSQHQEVSTEMYSEHRAINTNQLCITIQFFTIQSSSVIFS